MLSRTFVLLVIVLIAALPGGAQAQDPPAHASMPGPRGCRDAVRQGIDCVDECVHGGEHKPHTANLMGAKALAVTTLTRGHEGGTEGEAAQSGGLTATPHYGASLFYEREVITNWLEIELNVALLSSPGGSLMPIDLLLKKPFHASRHVTPYVAVGPALELVFVEDTEVVGGLTGAGGFYVWFNKSIGLDVELDYTMLFEREGLAHGIGGGIGPVVHF